MEIVLGIIIVLAALIFFGKNNKPSDSASVSIEAIREEYLDLTRSGERAHPDPSSMSFEVLLGRMQSEGSWIQRYSALPNDYQQSAEIKNQYDDKKLYVMELQVEFMKHGLVESGKKLEETIIPIMQRSIELMKTGMSEDEAGKQASKEFVQKRDAAVSVQPEAPIKTQ